MNRLCFNETNPITLVQTMNPQGFLNRNPGQRLLGSISDERLGYMKYSSVVKGVFIDRPNRFVARVRLMGSDGKISDPVIVSRIKNTSRYHKLPYIVEAVRLFLPEEQLYLFRIIWTYPINLEWYP